MTSSGRRLLEPGFAVLLILLFSGSGAFAQSLNRGPLQDLSAERAVLLGLAPAADAFHVLLVTIDGLRPGDTGAYGGKDALTPNLDALAQKSIRFDAAFAPSPRRSTAVVALVTSQYPSVIEGLGDTDRTPSLGAQFADKGFSVSAAFHSNILNPQGARLGNVANDLGFGRAVARGLSPEALVGFLERTVAARRDEQIFTWVHIPYPYPPATYHPGFDYGPTREQHANAAVRAADDTLGRLLDVLKKNRLDESTVTVVLAPSPRNAAAEGDDARQNGLGDADLRVPMLIYLPGLTPKVVTRPVETIDVGPTLFSILGRSCGYSVQGLSFLADMVSEPAAAPRNVFAEAPALAGRDTADATQAIFDGRFRFVQRGDGTDLLFDGADPAAGDVAAKHADVVKRLKAELEITAIFNAACTDAWQRGDLQMPSMTGDDGDYARARWLARNRDRRAREYVVALIDRSKSEPREALRILFDVGDAADAHVVQRLLSHDEPGVKALAGAFLARFAGDKKGVDYALSGLRKDAPERELLLIIDALGTSGAKEALEPLRKFEADGGAVAAARALALARLGDAEGIAALRAHVLDPDAHYDKRPYIETYEKLSPGAAADLLALCLTDGDSRSGTAAAAIAALERLNARHHERSVAAQLQHPDRDVRQAADRLLRSWGSIAGFDRWAKLALAAGDDFAWTARSLALTPGLLSSPLLPGVRLDASLLAAPQPGVKLEGGFPVVDRRVLKFMINAGDAAPRLAGARFRLPEPPAGGIGDVAVRCIVNNRSVGQRLIQELEGAYYFCGSIPEGALESGLNEVQFRVSTAGNEPVNAVIEAFFLLPSKPEGYTAVGGATESAPSRAIAFPRGVGELRLFWQTSGEVATAASVRILDGNKEVLSVPLAASSGFENVVLRLPERPWSIANARLEISGVRPAAQKISVMIYARRAP